MKYPNESRGLEPEARKDFVLGITKGVNDESAALVEGFIPTRYELKVLAEHYSSAIERLNKYWEVCGLVSGSEVRLKTFAQRRCESITKALNGLG